MREFVSVHTFDEHPGVGTLLLSRPPKNALTRQMCREIVSAAAEIGSRDDLSAVILFGGHEIFFAGDDTAVLQTLTAEEAAVFVQHAQADGYTLLVFSGAQHAFAEAPKICSNQPNAPGEGRPLDLLDGRAKRRRKMRRHDDQLEVDFGMRCQVLKRPVKMAVVSARAGNRCDGALH